ncbi:MAG: regulatory iron-sulfur-containing complex subunit RicT [candidate division WOR-3 bacterium]|nr:regulatory iron-sulfur-containing complex subunit RicT [candidate division WOR-3 bacterium]
MYARVEFRGHLRYLFNIEPHIDVKEEGRVICKHDQGLDVGKILDVYARKFGEVKGRILRMTTEDDERLLRSYTHKEKNAFHDAVKIINNHKLDIKLVDIQVHFDGQRMTFFFVSDRRVDFRALVRSLASHFHTRIRMKQIGVRDYAKHLGGLGPCGMTQCCSKFLNRFEAISLNHLKEQNLSMTPQKMSGMCGRLLCCLKYELDFYNEANKKFPDLYSRVSMEKLGPGKITKVDIYRERVTVQYEKVQENGGVVVHTLEEFNELIKKSKIHASGKNSKEGGK